MSLKVTQIKSEREQIVELRRQAVFMFIATHLDADGCFSESDTYIANTVAGSNRNSVSRARQSLEERGDVIVLENDRYDAKTGRKLPNTVRPVPIRTFWVREWIRQGSKTESREHGENSVSRARLNPSNDAGLTQEPEAFVPTAKARAHEHKNINCIPELQHSKTVGLQSIAYSACSRAHGESFTKYIDPPVRRALARLRGELEKARGYLGKYDSAINRENVRRFEQQIAELEGTL